MCARAGVCVCVCVFLHISVMRLCQRFSLCYDVLGLAFKRTLLTALTTASFSMIADLVKEHVKSLLSYGGLASVRGPDGPYRGSVTLQDLDGLASECE